MAPPPNNSGPWINKGVIADGHNRTTKRRQREIALATEIAAPAAEGGILTIARKPKDLAPFPRERFLEFVAGLKIISKDFGLIPFELLGSQRYILDEICKGMAEGVSSYTILKARQLGASSFFVAVDLFYCWEFGGLSGAFVTHTEQSRDQFRNTLKTYAMHLPPSRRVPYVTENRNMAVFKNQSVLSYLVAGVKEKAGGSLGRSAAFNFLHCTEGAFWGCPDDIAELRTTLSTHHPHRLEIHESTANGFNHFAEMWEDAKKDPTQRAIFVGWWRNELYRFERDNKFFEEYTTEPYSSLEKQRCAAVKRLYGFEIVLEQIAWYRWKFITGSGRDQSKMDEMFPWTEDDAFVASGSKYFRSGPLTDAMKRAKTTGYSAYKYRYGEHWDETEVHNGTRASHDLKIFEPPCPSGVYVMGCDPAYGTSDTADRSVISVFRCFADRAYQVAEFCTPTISTYECAWTLCHLAGLYDNTMVILEISGPGAAVFQEMNSLKIQMARAGGELSTTLLRMKHYLYRRVDSVTGGGLAYQWRMSRDLKWAIMAGFKDSFELHRAIINSLACLEEMKTITVQDGIIEAAGKGKDDRVMAAGMAIRAWKQSLQPGLIANGMTYDRWLKDQEGEAVPEGPYKVVNYLRQAGVDLPKKKA